MKYPMIRKNGRLSSSLAAVTSAALSAGLLHTSPVFAQADGSAYEEVVVTARKRDEKLLEIPLSMTAISASDIEDKGINLSLETDLDPKSFLELLNKFNSKRITVNYDIGNSASLGFDLIEELDTYGNRITDIHIKDRVLNGGPVVLGEGNADFKLFFTKLKEFNYKGPFIMQAYRDDEGIEVFKQQYKWISKLIYG